MGTLIENKKLHGWKDTNAENETNTELSSGEKVSESSMNPMSQGSKCSICQDTELYTDILALPCAHHFHEQCISEWLKKKSICPICRHRIGGAGDVQDDGLGGGYESEPSEEEATSMEQIFNALSDGESDASDEGMVIRISSNIFLNNTESDAYQVTNESESTSSSNESENSGSDSESEDTESDGESGSAESDDESENSDSVDEPESSDSDVGLYINVSDAEQVNSESSSESETSESDDETETSEAYEPYNEQEFSLNNESGASYDSHSESDYDSCSE